MGTAATTAHADRLVDTREVARGSYLAIQISPDGRDLLVTGPQLRGLQLVPLVGGAPRSLSDEAEAGVHARWLADGTIAYRAARAGTRRDLIVTRTGKISAPAASARSRSPRTVESTASAAVSSASSPPAIASSGA